MPFAPLSDGEPLYYEDHGHGPALVLITGLSGLATMWQGHLEVLSRHFRVILHDHRGTGRSSLRPVDFSVAQMAGDVIALMDHLDIATAHVVGHSTGGAMALVMALDHRERVDHAMIVSSWAGRDPYFDFLFHARALVLEHIGAAEYWRQTALIGKPPRWLAGHPEELRQPTPEEVAFGVASVECTLARIAAIRAFDCTDRLAEVACPCLIACARDDMVTPPHMSEAMAAAIGECRLDLVDWGGHFYPVIRPEVFTRQLLSFLGVEA